MVSLAPPLDARAAPNARASLASALTPAIAALVALAVVLFAPPVLNDGDTFWHLAAGAWMLDHGRVLRTDVFSHTAAGQTWIAHEWLSELAMAWAYRLAGWGGVVILAGLAAAATFAVLARRLSRALEPLSVILVLVLVFGCVAPSLLARPHLLALPMLALWTVGLLRARDADRPPPLPLAALMTLWANLHGGYVLGLALIGPFALEALVAAAPGRRLAVARGWAFFGLASLAAALVTPYGLSGLIYPFRILTMASLPGIAEWRPTDFSRPGALELGLLAGLFVMLQRGVRIPPLRLVLLLLLLHMALQHTRHQVVLAVVGALILAEPLGAALSAAPRRQAPASRSGWLVFALGALALCGVRLAAPIERVDGPQSPISALQHVPPELAAQPVFNDYGVGGYLIWRGVRPFIDGRSDMYGDAFTQAYFRADRPGSPELLPLLARWKVTWTLLPPSDPAVLTLDRQPGWRRLYADRYAVVHVRDGALP